MSLTKKILIVLATITLFAGPTQAAKYDINKKALKKIGKVALVSITLDNIDENNDQGNIEFLTQAVEHAVTTYRNRLANTGKWELVDAPELSSLKGKLSDIASTPQAHEVLTELADRNQLPGDVSQAMMGKLLMTAFRSGQQADMNSIKEEMIAGSAGEIQTYLNDMQSGLISPAGFPIIPYSLVDNRGAGKGLYSALREISSRILQSYCTDNGLDAVLVVHLASDKGKPGDIHIITQVDRILSSFKVNPTIVMRTADGSVGFDYGTPRLDDLAPMKLAMPIFRGKKNERGMMDNFRLDLNDPAGKSITAYKELIDSTAEKMMGKLIDKLP